MPGSKFYHIRMNNEYEWTIGPVEPTAPQNMAVVRVDRDGSKWLESCDIANVSMSDIQRLLDYCNAVLT